MLCGRHNIRQILFNFIILVIVWSVKKLNNRPYGVKLHIKSLFVRISICKNKNDNLLGTLH